MKKKNVLKKVDLMGLCRETNQVKLIAGNITLMEAWELGTDWYNQEKYSQTYIVYHTPDKIYD